MGIHWSAPTRCARPSTNAAPPPCATARTNACSGLIENRIQRATGDRNRGTRIDHVRRNRIDTGLLRILVDDEIGAAGHALATDRYRYRARDGTGGHQHQELADAAAHYCGGDAGKAPVTRRVRSQRVAEWKNAWHRRRFDPGQRQRHAPPVLPSQLTPMCQASRPLL